MTLHERPFSRQAKVMVPLICSISVCITRLPKPCRAGGVTGGPPRSVQRIASSSSSDRDHGFRRRISRLVRPRLGLSSPRETFPNLLAQLPKHGAPPSKAQVIILQRRWLA
jgi:hypothetical protein